VREAIHVRRLARLNGPEQKAPPGPRQRQHANMEAPWRTRLHHPASNWSANSCAECPSI